MADFDKTGTIALAFHYNDAKNTYSSAKLSLTPEGKVFLNMAQGVKGAPTEAAKVSMSLTLAEIAGAEAAFAEIKRRLVNRKIDSKTEE